MSDVNVLLCAVDSAMNMLAAFDRDRADVTARVSFALGSVLARVALETEQCRRALADAEATASCIYTQKGNKKIRKPQAANQTALIFDRRAAARLLSINSIRRLCWS